MAKRRAKRVVVVNRCRDRDVGEVLADILRRECGVGVVVVVALVARGTAAERALLDYRYFRALSIDLQGRPPTDDELGAFERGDFDLDAWIVTHLAGSGYAERLRRVYLDLLRLDLGPSFQ